MYDRTFFLCSGPTIVWINLMVLALPAFMFPGEMTGISLRVLSEVRRPIDTVPMELLDDILVLLQQADFTLPQ